MPEDLQAERTHTCMSCFGTFTPSRAAYACHGGSACPFDEPDNWENYQPDPVADWGPYEPDLVAIWEERRPQGRPFTTMDDPL